VKLHRTAALAAGITLVASALAACSSSSDSGGGHTVNWWTWDDKQAAAYKSCIAPFEKANPGTTVKITQYNVVDYFTKLTAGFVGGGAPDAFQNSVPGLDSYAKQHQLEPMDSYIKQNNFTMSRYSVGVSAWQYTDGKQYGLPLDWASSAIYYNKDLLAKAGYTEADVANLTFNPQDGGTFGKMVAHLTVDSHGVRGDQPGFDKNHVSVYGLISQESKDYIGQTTWNAFASALGWRLGDKPNWPTQFNYTDPRFVQTVEYMKSLSDKGFAPKLNQFTTSDVEQLGSKHIAMATGGSWEATTFAKLPGIKVGIAPTVKGPDGKRAVLSNPNGNNIWAGSKNKDAAWKWISFMGTEQCQTLASATGTFFPSIPASFNAMVTTLKKQGIDLSVFQGQMADGDLYTAPAYANGLAISDEIQPMFEAYFGGSKGPDVFAQMAAKAKDLLNKG